jgi:hypothetical protein
VPAQFWVSSPNSPGQGAGAAYASSTSATDVSPANPQWFTVPPLYVGQKFRFIAYGIFSNTSTPNLTLGFYWGAVAGTALLTSGVIATTTGATAWPWAMECITEVKTLGTSGTVWSKGWLDLPTSLTAIARTSMPATQTQPITVDTTTAKAVTAGATWGTNSASNTLTCEGFIVEQLN